MTDSKREKREHGNFDFIFQTKPPPTTSPHFWGLVMVVAGRGQHRSRVVSDLDFIPYTYHTHKTF